MKKLLLLGLLAFTSAALAGTHVEEFTSTQYKFSPGTTLIWNQGTGQLHPTMSILNWKPPSAAQRTTSFDFGDGRHGVFNQTTMRNFDSDGNLNDSVITIDTSTYYPLQVTDFILPSGYTLAPSGSNPLIIRSMRDVQILGVSSVIECSGNNGEATKNPENLTSAGGQGRCGGSNGGDGGRYSDLAGASPVASVKGYPQSVATTNILGGNGGAVGTFGGGGGGTYNNLSLPGNGLNGAAAQVGGTRGTNHDDLDFVYYNYGSAGGGGGGAYFTAPGNAANSTGAGGGAGGGVVAIYAQRDFYNQGTIKANGGNGGGVGTAGQLGGLGGGGGAGTVIIIAGRNYQNDGTVNVNPGSGGSRAGNAGDGGVGGPGRGWYTDSDGTLTGSGTETIACSLQQCGTIIYDTGTLLAESIAIDLQNTKPKFNSIQLVQQTPGASAITVTMQGSSDNFASDATAWLPITSPSALNDKRFVKFRVSINSLSSTSPAYLDSITLNFSESSQDNFIFTAGCGRLDSGRGGPTVFQFLFSILGMFLPYLLIRLTRVFVRRSALL